MDQQKTYENEKVTAVVTIEPGCQVRIEAEVNAELTQGAYKKATKKINKEVSVPGFRKGRAPDKLILEKYGKHVDSEFQDLVVQEAFNACMDLTDLYPLNNRSVKAPKVESCSAEGGAKIAYEFEGQPVVPELKEDEIQAPAVATVDVTEEQFQTAVDELKDVYTLYVETEEGHKLGEGDRAYLTIVGQDKSGNEVQLCNEMPFDMQDGKMGGWMQKLVSGQEKGATVEGVSEYEAENSTISEEEFEATPVKITIERIERADKPETEEALTERMQLETIEQMHERVRTDLSRRLGNQARAEAMTALREQLLAAHAFDLPSSVLKNEQETRMRNLLKALKEQGLSDDKIKENHDELEQKIAREADATLRLFFLLRPIAERLKMDIDKDEILREYSMQMYNMPLSERIIHEEMEPEEIRSRIYIELINHKVLDHLLGQEQAAA